MDFCTSAALKPVEFWNPIHLFPITEVNWAQLIQKQTQSPLDLPDDNSADWNMLAGGGPVATDKSQKSMVSQELTQKTCIALLPQYPPDPILNDSLSILECIYILESFFTNSTFIRKHTKEKF